MTALEPFHEGHGGHLVERAGRAVVDHYGRPERTHLAVRNGVGVTEQPYDILIITGDDRIEYVDNVVSNAVPDTTGEGTYALLLDPSGRIRLDLYVYTAPDRLLLFLPPGRAEDLAAEWREKVFIQDVALEVATTDYSVLAVTGPQATEKVASVMNVEIPQTRFAFTQGEIENAGVTLIRTDGLTGETSYEIVCATYDAEVVMDTLVNRGLNAVPFGRQPWHTLTLEAGSPLFDTELAGELPNVAGIRGGLDFEKGCYVGQEVVSRIENRGQPNERLVGLFPSTVPDAETPIYDEGTEIGRVTRAADSPSLEEPIAIGYVPYAFEAETVTVGDGTEATLTSLPFVDGSEKSFRLPTY